MWPTLLRDREALLQPAYALDSVLIELIFILGPLLPRCSPPCVSPASALIVSAASVVTGTVLVHRASRRRRAFEPDREAPGEPASARSPRRACARWCSPRCPPGIGIGMVEVGMPAFCRRRGRRRLAGLLLAVWSLGQRGGGLLYGALPQPAAARAACTSRSAGAAPARPAAAGGRAVGRRRWRCS